MKRTLPLLFIACFTTGALWADRPVAPGELPEAVSDAVETYFPGARIIAAEEDDGGKRIDYELKIDYREIRLEVEVSLEGKILDVEMDN